MEDDTGRAAPASAPSEIAFDYIKGKMFRSVHADGVIGGITPSGNLHVAFFNERAPIPQRETRQLLPDGSLGDVISDKSIIRPAVVREMDFDVVMSPAVARTFVTWLQQAMGELEKAAKL